MSAEVTRIIMADSSDQGMSIMIWGVFTDVCESLAVAGQTGSLAPLTQAEQNGPVGQWVRGGMVAVNPRQVFAVRPETLASERQR